MAKYTVILSSRAEKELKSIDTVTAESIKSDILSLEDNPRPLGVKKLKGYKDLWRIKSNVYRIIYRIKDDIVTVIVVRIAHRKKVYQNIKSL
ncbi:MAG: type II toxin-antitoxin system RelE/ParE family toxin [Synergistaceae bacterium]|nr:type II toxin-antitoxin system RelE/ParE family toxin [Synergistaceae bacterium]MBR0168388.1 type II toxin-antitoxin system RelE/ParE family toxin [Synergistaceae bacterium]